MAPRHSHNLVSFAGVRGRATAQKLQEFLEPDWCREFLKFLKGHGAVPRPSLVKVRRLDKTRHCAELSENAEACMLRLFPESYARWRATALRPVVEHSWVVGDRGWPGICRSPRHGPECWGIGVDRG